MNYCNKRSALPQSSNVVSWAMTAHKWSFLVPIDIWLLQLKKPPHIVPAPTSAVSQSDHATVSAQSPKSTPFRSLGSHVLAYSRLPFSTLLLHTLAASHASQCLFDLAQRLIVADFAALLVRHLLRCPHLL